VYLSTSSGTTAALAAGTWQYYSVTGTAPATAAFGEYGPTIGGTPPNGTAVFVDDTAMAPAVNVYSGFRFWGEVSAWPPAWTLGDRNVYTDITANGIWHRMSRWPRRWGPHPVNSLTGTSAPALLAHGRQRGLRQPGRASVAGTATPQSWITGTGLSLPAAPTSRGPTGSRSSTPR
jgi:hypothetical protein